MGTVASITPNEVYVEVDGRKQTGFIPIDELSAAPVANAEEIVKVGDRVELLIMKTNDVEGTIKLTVTALDDKDNVLNERSFEVPLYQNQITWFTGAFFDGSGASSSTITDIDINTEWAGEHHLTF